MHSGVAPCSTIWVGQGQSSAARRGSWAMLRAALLAVMNPCTREVDLLGSCQDKGHSQLRSLESWLAGPE